MSPPISRPAKGQPDKLREINGVRRFIDRGKNSEEAAYFIEGRAKGLESSQLAEQGFDCQMGDVKEDSDI